MNSSAQAGVEVQGLCFQFDRTSELLFDHLDLDFPARSISAVTGRSGSGKSTLLSLIGLLLSPTSGQITISGNSTAAILMRTVPQ